MFFRGIKIILHESDLKGPNLIQTPNHNSENVHILIKQVIA